MPARVMTWLYWAWFAALTVAFYAVPSWHMAVWTAIGLSSAVAITAGVLRHRPRRAAPWLVLAAAVLTFCAGDTTYNVLTVVLGQDNPFPSLADAFYLATVPLLGIGMVGLARSGVAGRDRASLIDSLILTAGLGLLSWIFLVQPYVVDPELTTAERLVSIDYPLGDVLVLATSVRLLAGARRSRAVTLLAAGSAGLLVSDVWYGLNQLGGAWEIGGALDFGWIVFYAAWGAAALHPSMKALTAPRVVRQNEITHRRLLLLGVSSLIPPAVLLVESLAGPPRDGVVIAVLSVVMFGLVLARLSGVVAMHRQALARERALRRAGAVLVSAADRAQVLAAVHAAVAELLPAGATHHVLLATPDDAGEAGLVFTRTLPALTAAEFGGFEMVVRWPLALADRPGCAPVGELLVGAAEPALVALQGSLEVLASQAALALERIALTGEVNRRISEEYFRTLVHNSTDVILIIEEDRTIRYASPSAAVVLGHRALAGVRLEKLVVPADRDRVRGVLDAVLAGGSGESADWTVLRADGGVAKAEVWCRDLRRDPTVNGLVLTLRDVTERRRLEAELTHRALHDELTGLANRVLFRDRTNRAARRAQRTGGLTGVLFVDLDDFKVVNDTLGHQIGDELLVAVGQRLTSVLRDHDTAARLGGDEFAILVEDATHPGDVELVAERVLQALAAPIEVRGELLGGHASVGVAVSAGLCDAAELLRQADLALYLAKSEGKGQWRRYEATLHTALLERLELRAALEKAVADGAFTLHYQPIVELASGATVGVEALVRWQHPTRGTIAPGQFIEVAEDSGLIVPIGSWVLRNAAEATARWRRELGADAVPYVSVNVSARQFRAPGFVDEVRRVLAETGLPASALLLEITESLLLRDDDQVWDDLAELRAAGVRIAIDDFGTGYSSLSYLRQVPIDVLKIDKSFVDTMLTAPQQVALVDGIVRLAHTLGLQVVAEGIEQEAERELLVGMGCGLGQGYLFARPMTEAAVTRWLVPERISA